MANAAGPIALVGLTLVGFAVLWARQMIYRGHAAHHQDVLRLLLSLSGSILILVGLLGAAAHVTYVLAPITCLATLAVALMLLMRYRALERRALLKCIAVAAEKGIPLNVAVRSFANERTDEVGYRALVLAESLEVGMNLPNALNRARTGLPLESLLAMRFGYETGMLGLAAARIARPDEGMDLVARALFEKYLYLGGMVGVMTSCVSFYIIKVMPVFQRMMMEFSLAVPQMTQLSIQVADGFASYWFVVVAALSPLGLLLVLSALYYVGLLPGDFPGVAWLARRHDAGLVLRCLALAVNRQWPLNKTIWMLSRIFPRRSMRTKLARAGRMMDNGGDWCESLWSARVIGSADRAVLRAAQRTGNVEWALDAMADSSTSRMIYRLRLFLNIAFPLVLLAFGLMVAFFVVAFFLPLVQMIQGLA